MMKVLIISHNPLCTYNAMGKTLASLFSRFSREELCQLYIYPSYPDMDLCSSYFRVTDKEVLHSIGHSASPGCEVDKSLIRCDQNAFADQKDETLYRSVKNKSPLRRLGRDSIWRLGRWYGPALRSWLDREAPSCIFVAPGPAKFLYDLALRISAERRIPIAVYLCDEFYFVQRSKKLTGRLQQHLLRQKMEQLLDRSSLLVTISQELKEAYSAWPSLPIRVLMTGSTLSQASASMTPKAKSISYFGNVRSNRYRSLAEIGQCLDKINKKAGSDYRLRVYTAEHDPEILAALKKQNSIELHEFLRGEAFEEALLQSELLVHVEAFDEQSVDRVKNSISTKIADGLACGVPLLAYGPEGIASIEHLRRNDCAFVCTDPGSLEEIVLKAMTDPESRALRLQNARKTAERFHDAAQNSLALHKMLEQLRNDV